MSEYQYDYEALQRHLSESQNLMIRKLEQANRAFEKAMEGIEKIGSKTDQKALLCHPVQISKVLDI